MRIPRRPAWPVVFLLASGASLAQAPIEALVREIGRWERIQAPSDEHAAAAFRLAFEAQTARWVERWPWEEIAWRQRLRALERAAVSEHQANQALAGAENALGGRPGLRFPEDTRFLMARLAVRHGVRLAAVDGWLDTAVAQVERELPTGREPIVQAYRRERLSEARWRAAVIRAEAAYRGGGIEDLREQVAALTVESPVPVFDPAHRIAAAEAARRRAAVLLWRARLARLSGDAEKSERYYERALAARPVVPGAPELPENAELIAEAAGSTPPGTPIPPAERAGPHWLPTVHPLESYVADGRPLIAVVWDGDDPRLARALDRLERREEVQVVSYPAMSEEWIGKVNPLYTAPQLWIADAGGVVRLVGRFQPGGDGWEDAVVGAALRLARSGVGLQDLPHLPQMPPLVSQEHREDLAQPQLERGERR